MFVKFYEVTYRQTYYIIGKKYVKSELGRTDAIRKTRLKYEKIIDAKEITEEQYKECVLYKKKIKQEKNGTNYERE